MITIITALYQEAKPVLDSLKLKKNSAEPLLTLFEGENIRVLVTGVGPIASCMAVSRYFSLFPSEKTDIIANIGLAGSTEPSTGSCYLALKLTERSTGRTFYPDLLYKNMFEKAEVTTSATVINSAFSTTADSILFHDEVSTLPSLFDMEATSVYQAALPYISPERMFFFKVISDCVLSSEENPARRADISPETLLTSYVSDILEFLYQVQEQTNNEPVNHPVTFSEKEQSAIAHILELLPMTVFMQQELFHLLRYHKLCGGSIEVLLSKFEATLPAELPHGKKQTKPYLDRLTRMVLEGENYLQKETKITNCHGTALKLPKNTNHYLPFFSNIYTEKELWEGKEKLLPSSLLSRFQADSETSNGFIPIEHYKDIFNRSHQNFAVQKHAPSLILAKKHGSLIYPGAPVCQSFGNEHFYYTSNIMNCIYNCDYCYLQGMYPSGHVVVFVNLDDYFSEVEELLKKHPVYLCISYDTDLLALEPLFHFTERWVRFAKHHPDLTLEIRTKSGNTEVLSSLKAAWNEETVPVQYAGTKNQRSTCVEYNSFPKNLVFAWTVSPDSLSCQAEHGAAPLLLRLKALKAAKEAGFSVRLCFDPMIYHPDWKNSYHELVKQVFETIAPDDLNDVSIGAFRISTEYLKIMRKKRPDSPVVQFPYRTEHGVSHYGSFSEEMVQYLYELLLPYLPAERIFVWKGDSE